MSSFVTEHQNTVYECDCGEVIVGFLEFSEHIKKHLDEMTAEAEA